MSRILGENTKPQKYINIMQSILCDLLYTYPHFVKKNYIFIPHIVNALLEERPCLWDQTSKDFNMEIVKPWLKAKSKIFAEFKRRVEMRKPVAMKKLIEMKDNKECLFFRFINRHTRDTSFKEVTETVRGFFGGSTKPNKKEIEQQRPLTTTADDLNKLIEDCLKEENKNPVKKDSNIDKQNGGVEMEEFDSSEFRLV